MLRDGPAPPRPTYPPAQERALRTWIALTRCHAALSRADAQLIRRHGLTPPQFAVLEALYLHGSLPLSQLGERLLVTSGNITYVVDNLVALGYVARDRCATDRRIVYARLTPRGAALLEAAFPAHAEGIERLFEVLTAREQDELRRLLKKLGRATERGDVEGG
ncbi:MAG TPA: MarR family transcriptional regulator [Gemmatimonadales bacterium]|nr:MarR family transcriptional regulator [Gemmatimonadales bacterium]